MKNSISLLVIAIILGACTSEPHQVTVESFADGSPKLVQYFKTESKEVLVMETQYYDNGKKYIEGPYKDGERDGIWTAWYRNGNLWSTGYYEKGKVHGKKTVYHENGQKYYEGITKNEKRLGIWTFWDEDGNKLNSIDYGEE